MERYGSWADIYTVTSYDAVKLVSQVIESYGVTSQNIQKGLKEIGVFSGIAGDIKFDERQCVVKPLMLKTISNATYLAMEG